MKFVFGFCLDKIKDIQDWNYFEENPLGGSETALLRVASHIQSLGHDVEIVYYPQNVEEFKKLVGGKKCDVFISLRFTEPFWAMEELPGKLNYYWGQDDADQPLLGSIQQNEELRKLFYQRVTGLFLLSQYQRTSWKMALGLDLDKTRLINNPIGYDQFKFDKTKLKNRKPLAYYSSAPFRGLQFLLKAWPMIYQLIPEAELHIFSSLSVYGGEETDKNKALYEQATSMPGVVYHGSVGQRVLREFELTARVLAYPCSFPETSCIAAMQAMAAGAVVVGTQLGALPETAWKNPMHPIEDGWLQRWAMDVAKLLVDNDYYESLALQNRDVAKFYDVQHVVGQMFQAFREDFAAIGMKVDKDLDSLDYE